MAFVTAAKESVKPASGSEETVEALARKNEKGRTREVGSTLLISEWPSRAATVVALAHWNRWIESTDAVTSRVHSSRSSDFRLCITGGRLTIALVKRQFVCFFISFFVLQAIDEGSKYEEKCRRHSRRSSSKMDGSHELC